MTQRERKNVHRDTAPALMWVALIAAVAVLPLLSACGKSGNEMPPGMNPIPPIRKAFVVSMKLTATQIRNYATLHGHVPEGDNVRVLIGAGISGVPLEDPWGSKVHYRGSGSSFVLSSAGPDRKWGTPDDIIIKGGRPAS